jgi:two-component system, OmpR family, sensor histidine kinase KdpD
MPANGDDNRPSPETLLKLAKAEEAEAEQAKQAKLKIFLGYAAGVGKTYAMLEAARQRKGEGRDVVVGYVESHGRSETDALLAGLEVISRKELIYQGVRLTEMDLDAVLARKPQIALVDELAHSNAPGSRHEKRWQDVEELLAAGIDVFTTVNIQHFESLNDVVAQITGVTVRETLPDHLLDTAFEIRLVDIPPEDLLQRLHEGKIYIADQAAKAIEKFFRPGNLMALRELSLRRTAARVDDQMRAYMETQAITGPWATTNRLLVCISGSPYSEKLIRATCRLAEELKAQWYTVYIETPESGKHARENRETYLARPAPGRKPGLPGSLRHRSHGYRCNPGLCHAAQCHQDRDGQTDQAALARTGYPPCRGPGHPPQRRHRRGGGQLRID